MQGANATVDEEDNILDSDSPSLTDLASRVVDAPRIGGRIRFRDNQLPGWARESGRDPTSDLIRPRRCGFYRPGHEVHWIQAKKSADAGACYHEGNRSRLVGVEDNLLILKSRDSYRAYWNHEVERLLEVVGGLGRYLYVDERWSIMRAGHSLFCLQLANRPWEPCPEQPLSPAEGTLDGDDLVELLEERGGFVVPFSQVRIDGGR